MAPRKHVSKPIWDYFENQPELGKAVCNVCKIVMKNDRVSNLKSHLLKLHKIDINNCEKSITSSVLVSSVFAKKQSIKIQMSKTTLFRSYIGLVTEDNIPFNVLNSPNLKNIIDPICTALGEKLGKRFTLNSHNCTTTLHKVAENIRANMKKEMYKRLLSLKIDSATRLSRNIFGISAQFIKDDEIQSLILGMVELKGIGASTSNNLAAEILKVLEKYDIALNQVISITSDNGSNMLKTTKILSNYNVSEAYEEEGNNVYLNNIDNLESLTNLRVGQIEICRCAAHTAQLCALDVTKDSEVKSFILSCRNFTKLVRKPSNGFRDAFELRGVKLPQLDCTTRWGSTYTMIQSLLAAKDVLIAAESISNKTLDENFDNSDSLWDFMECYCAVFAPLQEVITKFQAENLHYGNFYAEWLKCKIVTCKIVQNSSKDIFKKIGTKLLQRIEKRTSKLIENESFNACLFLDPRFHHTFTPEKRQKAVTYLKLLWDKLRSASSTSEGDTYSHVLVPNNSNFKNEAEEMLNSFLTEKLQNVSGDVSYTDVYSKIGNLHLPFLRSDSNVLQFWKERKHSEPELYALSNVCFGVPPTQVSIERAFSALKLILTDNRSRLSHETLEDILLVKLNSTFLNEAIINLPLFEDTNLEVLQE